uniref:Right handed beta helix domain-containing protein n=1 Tax=Leucosporidium scottii TaxID=5278 RepID=A0A0H5FTJ1_9BASI|nr:hypothetical protein ls5930a1_00061 [Leucosporidium scottii]
MLHDWRPTFALALLSLPSFAAAWRQQRFSNEPAKTTADCIDSASATEINHLLRTGGIGTEIILCPYAHVVIDPHGAPITFTAARQSIYTEGSPEDHTRATITIENDKGHYSGDLTTAIRADCEQCRGVQIHNLHVDGGRVELGGLEGGDALIVVGGAQGEQEVRAVDAWAARGYAILHADEGPQGTCTGVTITENTFHAAGDAPLDLMLNSELVRLRDGTPPYRGIERPGQWTDGISVACAQSTVSENSIRDISGVGIMLRGAHGSQITQNTIVARDRDMLVGISIVAHPVFTRRAAHVGGVIVRENRIHAASAMIRVGIATGAGVWSTDELIGDHEIAFGSEIVKNRLSSYTGYFAYAIAISDARGIVVNGNAISASIWGFETSACYERPHFAMPTPLIRDARSVIGSLQSEFKDQHFGFLLCVGPGTLSSSHELSRHQINDAYVAAHNGRRGFGRGVGAAGRHATIPEGEASPSRGGVIIGGKAGMKALQRKKTARHEGLGHQAEAKNVPLARDGHLVDMWAKESERPMQGMKIRQLKAPRRGGNRFAEVRAGSV